MPRLVIRLYWGEASTSWRGFEILRGVRHLVRDLRRHPTRITVQIVG